MPRKAWVTEQDFLDAYSVRIRDPAHPQFGQRVGYGRVWAQRVEGPYDDNLTRFINRSGILRTVFNIKPAHRVLIGGCGFGFLVDAFHDLGIANCWGVDDSAFITGGRGTYTRVTTDFVEDSYEGVTRVTDKMNTQTGGQTFQWVITESLLESYEDGEIPALLDASEVFLDGAFGNANIIHLVQSVTGFVSSAGDADKSIDPIYNQKTISEWKAIRPSHSWMDIATFEVG